MAVLTNFLKLLKPEKNDYVDVDKHISENYDKIDSKMQELDKKASKTELGRVKIGDNLTITEDGVLSGNPEYTHPTQAGYKHIPAGGTVGQVLKNNGDGSAEWGTLDIKDKLDRGNLPATVPDGKTIYDLLENNGGLNIDTALLYLNDSGTKTKGKVYFDRNKKGLFECIQTTTATTNSTTYFVDISNKANSDRFGNLASVCYLGIQNSQLFKERAIAIPKHYSKVNIKYTGGSTGGYTVVDVFSDNISNLNNVSIGSESKIVLDSSDNSFWYFHLEFVSGDPYDNYLMILAYL